MVREIIEKNFPSRAAEELKKGEEGPEELEVWFRQVYPCWVHWTVSLDQQDWLFPLIDLVTRSMEKLEEEKGGKYQTFLFPALPTIREEEEAKNPLKKRRVMVTQTHSLVYQTLLLEAKVDRGGFIQGLQLFLCRHPRFFDEETGETKEREEQREEVTLPEKKPNFSEWVNEICQQAVSVAYKDSAESFRRFQERRIKTELFRWFNHLKDHPPGEEFFRERLKARFSR